MIVPTHRDKLPKGFSYPIGSEAIHQLLGNVEVYNSISLWFSDHYGFSKAPFFRDLSGSMRLSIICISFRPAQSGPSIGSTETNEMFRVPSWKMNVYPVTSQDKDLVYQAIMKSRLTGVVNWFHQSKNETWLFQPHTIWVEFSRKDKSISFSEQNR